MTATATERQVTYPVVEVFGPTIQGEGPDAGAVCCFVRLGGCDYRCSWCDSMYAVEPAEVRKAERLGVDEIAARVALLGGPLRSLVVLSGGNPALHECGPLVSALRRLGYRVSVETQGSVWRDWLGNVDRLVISPKPPSSGMATERHAAQTRQFMAKACACASASPVLKMVAFDDRDLEWAAALANEYLWAPLYLSAGTEQGLSGEVTKDAVLERYRWLCEAVVTRHALVRARVLPQLHVLAWGVDRGH